uniref:Uncharacterized protein n=1 Tax=Arundo donax TaxID=35708 RepID=A0A0A8YQX6_ARUDO
MGKITELIGSPAPFSAHLSNSSK